MKRRSTSQLTVLMVTMAVAGVLATAAARAEDWPAFRGANRDGVSTAKGWVVTASPKQLWKLNAGVGASSFSVVGGKLYTMGNEKGQDVVWCLDAATGKEVWHFAYACKFDKRSYEGGTACTPTIDGDRVYTLSEQGQLYCLDAASGKPVWQKELLDKELGGRLSQWHYSCSPLVDGENLIVDVGGDGNSTIAFDKKTGAVKWKAGRDPAGYSSPIIGTIDGKRTLLMFKAQALVGLDPADGKEFFRFGWKTEYDVNVAVPIVYAGKVFIASGYNRGCALVQVKDGKASAAWENKNMRNHCNCCVAVGDYVYGFDGQVGGGSLVCLKLADGSVTWSKKGLGTGTVVVADGKLIALGERGELVIAEAAPEYKELARFQAIGGHCWVMPVLANGKLYCRNNGGDVVCLDMSK